MDNIQLEPLILQENCENCGGNEFYSYPNIYEYNLSLSIHASKYSPPNASNPSAKLLPLLSRSFGIFRSKFYRRYYMRGLIYVFLGLFVLSIFGHVVGGIIYSVPFIEIVKGIFSTLFALLAGLPAFLFILPFGFSSVLQIFGDLINPENYHKAFARWQNSFECCNCKKTLVFDEE